MTGASNLEDGDSCLKAHLSVSVQTDVLIRKERDKGNKEIRGRGRGHAGSVLSGPLVVLMDF